MIFMGLWVSFIQQMTWHICTEYLYTQIFHEKEMKLLNNLEYFFHDTIIYVTRIEW